MVVVEEWEINFISINRSFITTRENILNYLKENKQSIFSKYHLTKLGIFGSYARGDHKKDGDLDLIVEFDDNTENLFFLKQDIKEKLMKELNLKVDICREKYIKPLFRKIILSETIYV